MLRPGRALWNQDEERTQEAQLEVNEFRTPIVASWPPRLRGQQNYESLCLHIVAQGCRGIFNGDGDLDRACFLFSSISLGVGFRVGLEDEATGTERAL